MKSDLIRAAEALEYEAELIRRSYTIPPEHREWHAFDRFTREQKARHDDYLALANRLRKSA